LIQRPRGSKGREVARLEAHAAIAMASGNVEQLTNQRSTNTLASRLHSNVHRLQFAVTGIQLLESGDAEQTPVRSGAEERDGRPAQGLEVKGKDAALRGDLTSESQVSLEKLNDVRSAGIFDEDNDRHT
jgi:hypothetical protein